MTDAVYWSFHVDAQHFHVTPLCYVFQPIDLLAITSPVCFLLPKFTAFAATYYIP